MRDTSRRIRRMRREKAARAYRRLMLRRLAILFAVLAVLATVGISAITTAFAKGSVYMTITAEKGDTLWSIASEHNAKNRDVRAVVDEIMRANNMDSARIRVGDRINVPIS